MATVQGDIADERSMDQHETLKETECGDGVFPHVDFNDGPPLSCLPSCMSLAVCTLFGCVLGIAGGWICSESDGCNDDWRNIIGFPGDLWVRALRLLVLPLMTSIMILMPSSTENIGQLGFKVFAFYVCTSLVAASEGLIWGNLLRPGDGVNFDAKVQDQPNDALSVLDTVLNIGVQAVPSNVVQASANLEVLGLITVFGGFGVALRKVKPEQRNVVVSVAGAILHCTMLAVVVLAKFTPIGMASRVFVAISGVVDITNAFKALGLYGLTMALANLVHGLIFYAIVYTIGMMIAESRRTKISFCACLARVHPFRSTGFYMFVWRVKQALLTALATSSSAATLPVTLQAAKSAGVAEEVGNFVLPLGSAVNLDGTSLGFPIMTLFAAQLFNYEIPAARQIAVMLVSVVCSIGTAPIPNAGIVYLVLILTTAGGPLAQADVQGIVIGLVLVLDWLVDRMETCTNVLSDCVTAQLLSVGSGKEEADDSTANAGTNPTESV